MVGAQSFLGPLYHRSTQMLASIGQTRASQLIALLSPVDWLPLAVSTGVSYQIG